MVDVTKLAETEGGNCDSCGRFPVNGARYFKLEAGYLEQASTDPNNAVKGILLCPPCKGKMQTLLNAS